MKHKLIGIAVSAALLTACASKPKPEAMAPTQTQTSPLQMPEQVRPVPQQQVIQQTAPMPYVDPNANAPIPGSLADFVYQSGEERVYFGYNRYDLSAEAREVLKKQAQWLSQYNDVTVVVAGNADERGTREYNLALGARRADMVKSFLVGQGVSPTRLTTVSYGKERPIDGRSDEDGWSRNRNGHTNIVSGAIG